MTSTVQAVRERPILFSGSMVRAILDGTKTQTRRVVKLPSHISHGDVELTRLQPGYPDGPRPVWDLDGEPNAFSTRNCYGQPGDRLWVRETLKKYDDEAWYYDADGEPIELDANTLRASAMLSWAYHNDRESCPSIHMPRWASRITLEITDVRVQRVQEISEQDAQAEGFTQRGVWWDVGADWKGDGIGFPDARDGFAELWDSINEKRGYSWASNPWVWAVTFKRLDA